MEEMKLYTSFRFRSRTFRACRLVERKRFLGFVSSCISLMLASDGTKYQCADKEGETRNCIRHKLKG